MSPSKTLRNHSSAFKLKVALEAYNEAEIDLNKLTSITFFCNNYCAGFII